MRCRGLCKARVKSPGVESNGAISGGSLLARGSDCCSRRFRAPRGVTAFETLGHNVQGHFGHLCAGGEGIWPSAFHVIPFRSGRALQIPRQAMMVFPGVDMSSLGLRHTIDALVFACWLRLTRCYRRHILLRSTLPRGKSRTREMEPRCPGCPSRSFVRGDQAEAITGYLGLVHRYSSEESSSPRTPLATGESEPERQQRSHVQAPRRDGLWPIDPKEPRRIPCVLGRLDLGSNGGRVDDRASSRAGALDDQRPFMAL